MTKDEILNNQALSQHMLFYSPLNKHAVFEKTGIHYEDQKPGVRILDYGKAEFNFPAVEAESVTVKGWGGSMPGECALHRLEILRRLTHEEGRCVIVVTHDPEAAESADLVLRMKDGVLTAA
jgi:hypothetical protein